MSNNFADQVWKVTSAYKEYSSEPLKDSCHMISLDYFKDVMHFLNMKAKQRREQLNDYVNMMDEIDEAITCVRYSHGSDREEALKHLFDLHSNLRFT